MVAVGKTAQIPNALLTRAALMASTGPTLPVAFDEDAEGFEPPEDGKYLSVGYQPNRHRWEGITSGRLNQGLLTISVVWPKNLGIIAPMQVAALVEAHFPKNSSYIDGTTKVKISEEPWAASPLTDGLSSRIPVTIPWVA